MNITSITCGCDWIIRFRGTCRNNNNISDPVVITTDNTVIAIRATPPTLVNLFNHEIDLVGTSVVVVKS